MKKCTRCGQDKELIEFYQRRKHRSGEYYEKCKECYKERGRNYYHQNRKRQLYLANSRRKRYFQERKKWLEQIKNKPCADCGKIYPPWVMDFDHIDSQTKIGSIYWLTFRNTSNFEKIKKEIEKCELICANCHRQRTHDRIVKLAEVAKVVTAGL